MITITPKDALKAKTLPPGWQICVVDNHYVKPSQNDGSNVHFYEITIVEGEHKGTPLQEYTISEKALGMGKSFFLATGMPLELWERAEKGEAVQFNEKNPVGKTLRVMVKPEAFNNRMLNKAVDFMSLEQGAATV